MREHEVPTHVQAEDRVLLGFTFPQVVAVMAVFALSYGAYRYAPVGPSEVRMALADDHEPWRRRDRLRGEGARHRTADIRRGAHRHRRPRRRHPAGRHRPGHPGAGLRRPAGELAALLGLGNAGRGGEHRLLPPPPRPGAVLKPSRGRTPSARPGR